MWCPKCTCGFPRVKDVIHIKYFRKVQLFGKTVPESHSMVHEWTTYRLLERIVDWRKVQCNWMCCHKSYCDFATVYIRCRYRCQNLLSIYRFGGKATTRWCAAEDCSKLLIQRTEMIDHLRSSGEFDGQLLAKGWQWSANLSDIRCMFVRFAGNAKTVVSSTGVMNSL